MKKDSASKDRPLIMDMGSTTWRVLVALISLREFIGPRELARHMDLSSPSVALYHLEKLMELNLLEKSRHGEYRIHPKADIGFLDNFLFMRQKIVPRTLFYAVFFTGIFIFYMSTVRFSFEIHNVFAIVLGTLGCTFLWAEVYRIWQGLV